jgi:hypothetical protein
LLPAPGRLNRAHDDPPAPQSHAGPAPTIGVAGRRTPIGAPAAQPLAVTTAGGTYVCRDGIPAGLKAEVAAHEQIHREQFALGRQRGGGSATPAALEREAAQGAKARLSGMAFQPALAAADGQALGYGVEDWLPDPGTAASAEAAGLVRAGLDTPGQQVAIELTSTQDGGQASVHYDTTVSGGGSGGSVLSTTSVTLARNPDARVTLVGPPVVMINPELGLGPAEDVPAYPYVLSYVRVISYRDSSGRRADVQIDGRVWFSDATIAAQVTTGQPSYDALLALIGDAGLFRARLVGSGPVRGEWIDHANTGLSLSAQSGFAASEFFRTAGPDYAGAGAAVFLDPRIGAGDQFTAIHDALELADSRARARLLPATVREPGWLDDVVTTVAGWLDALADLLPDPPQWLVDAAAALAGGLLAIAEWWAGLPPWLRGIAKAVAYFAAALLVIAGFAGLVVAGAEAFFGVTLAFGTVMLVIGAGLLVLTYVGSVASRVSEALAEDNLLALANAPVVGLMDVVGLSSLVEALTDRSVLTGKELEQSEEQRWERGTTGLLQMVATLLMVRGAVRGAPAPRGTPAEVNWIGNAGEFRTLPEQRLGPLPEGHSWRRAGNGDWIVERAQGAPEAPVEVIVSRDGNGRVSHIVRSGERTLHHDTMPRAAGDLYDGKGRYPAELRKAGPENPYRETGKTEPWGKGHTHDYADTYDTPDAYDLNKDPRNYQPQAEWWNEGVRNKLVQQIRKGGGGYREVGEFDPARPARATVTGKPIPDGFLFIETDAAGHPVRAWRVPNNDALTTRTLDVLPSYAVDLSTVPRGIIAADGTVAAPGSLVVGVPILGERGDDEKDDR